MDHIVVGMDGSTSAAGALEWAAALARATGATVTAINAHVAVQSEKRPGYLERLLERRRQELTGWCGDILDGVVSTTEVIDGDPRNVLPTALERLDADLLVVASEGQHSRGPGFLHVGSVVEHLAHHLSRPMAVITPGAPTATTRIVVGIDGSDHGRRAVAWTAEVASATSAHVIGLAVAEAGHPIAATNDTEPWHTAAEAVVSREWATPLMSLGDRFRAVATSGVSPADALLVAADDSDADLIVVGARGLGGFAGLRIGGTALSVLHRTTRPVVLVPSPDE